MLNLHYWVDEFIPNYLEIVGVSFYPQHRVKKIKNIYRKLNVQNTCGPCLKIQDRPVNPGWQEFSAYHPVHVQGGRSQKYEALQLQSVFHPMVLPLHFCCTLPYRPKEIWSMEVETQHEKILLFEISLTTPLWMDDPKKKHSELMTTHGACFRFGFQKRRFVLPKCKTLSASHHIRLKTHRKLLLSINSISIMIDSLKIHPFFSNPLSNLWAQSVSETSLWVKLLHTFGFKECRGETGEISASLLLEPTGVKRMDKEIAYKTNDLGAFFFCRSSEHPNSRMELPDPLTMWQFETRYTTKININRNR